MLPMSESGPFDELPELMRSLRSFGSRRGGPDDAAISFSDQNRFFAPLLEGRRSATQAISRPQVVAAFDARRLTAAIDATIRAFAAERFATDAPARRALEAELFEIVQPLRGALQLLARLGEPIPLTVAAVKEEYWTVWLTQLRVVFHLADASWPALREALATSPRARGTTGRWPFGSRGDRR